MRPAGWSTPLHTATGFPDSCFPVAAGSSSPDWQKAHLCRCSTCERPAGELSKQGNWNVWLSGASLVRSAVVMHAGVAASPSSRCGGPQRRRQLAWQHPRGPAFDRWAPCISRSSRTVLFARSSRRRRAHDGPAWRTSCQTLHRHLPATPMSDAYFQAETPRRQAGPKLGTAAARPKDGGDHALHTQMHASMHTWR
jgi:hypothetical protein